MQTSELQQQEYGSSLKRYWADVRSGKVERVKPWSKKKGIEMRPKLEPSPDEEAEEIRKELDKRVSDKITLGKPEVERKKPETSETKHPDSSFLVYGIITLGAVGLVSYFLSRRNSSQTSEPPQPSQPKTRQFDIGGGRVIEIPV